MCVPFNIRSQEVVAVFESSVKFLIFRIYILDQEMLTLGLLAWAAKTDPIQPHKIVMPASEPASTENPRNQCSGCARVISAKSEQWIARSDASAQGRNDGNWLKIAAWQGNISAR